MSEPHGELVRCDRCQLNQYPTANADQVCAQCSKPLRRERKRIITRISGCPHCFKYNTVPVDWSRYRCGHCDKPVDCAAPEVHPTTGEQRCNQRSDQ